MRPRWILPVVLVAAIITAAAGLVARAVYTRPIDTESAAVLPDKPPVPPAKQPGDSTVEGTTDAVAHPLYLTMRGLLQTYFDSINTRRYDVWRTVVSRHRLAGAPEKKWREDFQSTKDGSIVVRRIESGPAGTARILLTFTSTQDPADAPSELPEPCIHWWLVFPVTLEDGAWKLDAGPAGTTPQHEKC